MEEKLGQSTAVLFKCEKLILKQTRGGVWSVPRPLVLAPLLRAFFRTVRRGAFSIVGGGSIKGG